MSKSKVEASQALKDIFKNNEYGKLVDSLVDNVEHHFLQIDGKQISKKEAGEVACQLVTERVND